MENGWLGQNGMQPGQRRSYCKRHLRDESGLARWRVVKMVRTKVLEVDFQKIWWHMGGKVRESKNLSHDPRFPVGATPWIKRQF